MTAKKKAAKKTSAKKANKNAASKTAAKVAGKTAKKRPATSKVLGAATRPAGATKAKKSYELKTKETAVGVDDFIASVDSPARREQARTALAMLGRITGEPPKMWGPSIVGFGRYAYVYESGHSGEMCVIGFSPRKAQFVFYLNGRPADDDPAWARLGKHKLGGACLYVNRFEDVDMSVLESLLKRSYATMRARYPDRAPAS